MVKILFSLFAGILSSSAIPLPSSASEDKGTMIDDIPLASESEALGEAASKYTDGVLDLTNTAADEGRQGFSLKYDEVLAADDVLGLANTRAAKSKVGGLPASCDVFRLLR